MAALLAFVFVMAACGGGDDGGDGGDGGGTIRFVFSPDPVWNWIEDQGILAEMEAESGFTIERFESEDEFAFFAGGHADVVSTGSYETPVLESENGVPTVTIGKYNMAKDIVVVAADSGYETFADLPQGCKVGVESFSGSTIVWQALAKDLDGRTLAEDESDLQMAITDFDLAPELVLSGDLCAGVTSIYNAMGPLMAGDIVGAVRQQVGVAALRGQLRTGSRGNGQQQLRRPARLVRRSHPGSGVLPVGLATRGWTRGPRTARRSSRPTRTTSATRTTRSWPTSTIGTTTSSTSSSTRYTSPRTGSTERLRSRSSCGTPT